MEINWIAAGWVIDMLLNGFVWVVIAVIFLMLVDMTDAWTRKAVISVSYTHLRAHETN